MAPPFDRRSIPAAAREAQWTAPGGHMVRRIDWDPAPGADLRGSILFLPGRGDFYDKYLETLAGWSEQGWRVTASDWRGQAGSGRMSADPLIGDIADFAVWIDDLAALWQEWQAQTPAPHVLIGHSMGGHLILRALAERRVDPAAMVLSAPMLGFVSAIPASVQHLAARLMCRIGNPARAAWKSSEKPGSSVADRAKLLTFDPDRYADEIWWREARPELLIGPASWRWVERAAASVAVLNAPGALEAVNTPVLLLAARDDRLVTWTAIERAAKRLPHAELVSWGAEARHELLREADAVRDAVLHAIDAFLGRAAAAHADP
jgi:lysophospholipase